MLDKDFCDHLEIEICNALKEIDNPDTKGFWCDGVVPSEPDQYYSQKFINDKREATLRAYIGKVRQSIYELTLIFGTKALSRYARNLSILECIPNSGNLDWFSIDVQKSTIEIRLD
jgi:hypothetical protein